MLSCQGVLLNLSAKRPTLAKIGSAPLTCAYVANYNSDTVTPIRTATNTALKAIKVGSEPFAIAINPDGKTAYVPNYGGDHVTPISIATNTARKAIKSGAARTRSRSPRTGKPPTSPTAAGTT